MSGSDKTAREVSAWLSYAYLDLKAAETLMKGANNFSSQVCFLSQQAAEKAIKAALIFLGIEFPFSHDLDRLRELLTEDWTC